jgi:hypothetical protein
MKEGLMKEEREKGVVMVSTAWSLHLSVLAFALPGSARKWVWPATPVFLVISVVLVFSVSCHLMLCWELLDIVLIILYPAKHIMLVVLATSWLELMKSTFIIQCMDVVICAILYMCILRVLFKLPWPWCAYGA